MVVVLTADCYIAIYLSVVHRTRPSIYSTLSPLRRAVVVLWVLAVASTTSPPPPRFFQTEVLEVETGHVTRDVSVLNGSDVVYSTTAEDRTLVNLSGGGNDGTSSSASGGVGALQVRDTRRRAPAKSISSATKCLSISSFDSFSRWRRWRSSTSASSSSVPNPETG